MLALARGKQQPEPLIIRPSSQWYAHYASQEASLKQKPVLTMRDEFGVWHVCLSMHSSREELEQALRFAVRFYKMKNKLMDIAALEMLDYENNSV